MDLQLQGKIAVVTGASKGIGLAVTKALVDEGVQVVAAARHSSEELDQLTKTGAVRVVTVDLSEVDAPAQLIREAGPRIDILVNNVGAALPRLQGFLKITEDQWLASLNINLLAAVRATRAALPGMISAGKGAIVNIGSVNAFLPVPGVLDYGVAKAGLANFAKALSKEIGPLGIRINTIAPGPVATALWLGDDGVAAKVGAASGQKPEDVAAAAVSGTATGRFTQPEEVAKLAAYLASDASANVTGASITIDGGLIATL
jgi:NAD(P)-dependent dehydrogenase (short-subunit alcohol dehydrogenase family)